MEFNLQGLYGIFMTICFANFRDIGEIIMGISREKIKRMWDISLFPTVCDAPTPL